MNLQKESIPGTSGRYCSQYSIDHPEEELFLIKSKKIIVDIIYRRAVEIHENHEDYNEGIKNAIIGKINEKVPELKDFPILLEHYERTLDKVCKQKMQ